MRQVNLQRFTLCSALLLLALILSSCASSADPASVDTPTPTEPSITLLGVVGLEVYPRGVVASGTFVKTAKSLGVQTGNPYAALADQCSVISEGESTPALPGETPGGARPIDAGETLLVKNGSRPFLELSKDAPSELITYTASTGETLPSAPLTLDIPGQDFPAFTDAKFETIPTFELTEPVDTIVTPETTFRWTNTSDNGVISLQITQFEPDITVICFAKDDGEFSFPETTKAELEALNFTTGELRLPTRLAARYEVRDGAALLLITRQQEPR